MTAPQGSAPERVEVAVSVVCGRCHGSGDDPHLGGGNVGQRADGTWTSRVYRSPCGPCGGTGSRTITAPLASPVDAAGVAYARALATVTRSPLWDESADRLMRTQRELYDVTDAYRAALRAADTTRGEETNE